LTVVIIKILGINVFASLIPGTVVDSGVFAPVLTFQKLFEDEGVPITSDEVRGPMGVHKRVNIATLS
jgi:hypothetical protein